MWKSSWKYLHCSHLAQDVIKILKCICIVECWEVLICLLLWVGPWSYVAPFIYETGDWIDVEWRDANTRHQIGVDRWHRNIVFIFIHLHANYGSQNIKCLLGTQQFQWIIVVHHCIVFIFPDFPPPSVYHIMLIQHFWHLF